jgi:hypothetical protein
MSLLYLVLSDVSICYPSLRGKFFTRYSPVRHDTFYRSRSSHRLACVKHSVSVHPEPGSNSSFNSCYFLLHLILYPFLTSLLLLLMFSLSSPIRIDKINIITLTSTMSTTFLLFFSFLSLLFRNTKKSLYYKAFLFYKISNSSEFSLYVLSS